LRDLDRALARIPEERRQVILLIGLEDISYKEAATILDVPIGTIRSRLSRGRESLRALMDGRDGTPRRSAREILGSARFAESKSRYHTRPKYFSSLPQPAAVLIRSP